MRAAPDPGLARAIAAKGGLRPLARALGLAQASLQKWPAVPQGRVFAVARATGILPEILRPDLEDWIREERGRQRLAAARERFSLAKAAVIPFADPPPSLIDQLTIDLWVSMAAVRFVAGERAVAIGAVIGGRSRFEMGARAWAMGLAHVAGRASSTAIGAFFGTSRQNVDNASERYLRARDGDDPEDFVAGQDGKARVLERGRYRPAKTAALDLWAAEARFSALIEGDPAPERKRA